MLNYQRVIEPYLCRNRWSEPSSEPARNQFGTSETRIFFSPRYPHIMLRLAIRTDGGKGSPGCLDLLHVPGFHRSMEHFHGQCSTFLGGCITGWWFSPLLWKKKKFVSWDDEIPNINGKIIQPCSSPHQPRICEGFVGDFLGFIDIHRWISRIYRGVSWDFSGIVKDYVWSSEL